MGTVPVCPPPSPPWAMTASTPHSATFSAWRRAPTVGMTTKPASLQTGDQGGLGGLGEAGHPHPRSIISSMRSCDVGHVGAQVDAEGPVGAGPHLGDGGGQLVEAHGGRGQDAEPARLGGGRHQPGAGHPAHAGLHERVAHADQFAQAGVERRVGPSGRGLAGRASGPHLAVTKAPGSSTLADELELLGRGQAASRPRRPGSPSSKPVAATMSSTVTPGWCERRRMVRSGVSKSNTPRFDTTRRIVVEAGGRGPGRGGPGVAHAARPRRPARRRCAVGGRAPSSWWGG